MVTLYKIASISCKCLVLSVDEKLSFNDHITSKLFSVNMQGKLFIHKGNFFVMYRVSLLSQFTNLLKKLN